MSHNKRRVSSGFTIIELMLAMAFVSVLLIVITLTVIQIGNVYNKGLTMRAVDQSGTAISSDIRQTLSASQPFDVSASHFCLQSSNGGCICIESATSDCSGQTENIAESTGGRLCTGTYSYIWNIGKSTVNAYKGSDKHIGFIRVRDGGGAYCSDIGGVIDPTIGNPTEFLSATNSDLSIQSFSILKIADDSAIGQALYNVVFELGTNDEDALQQSQQIDPVKNINTIDTSCRPPSDDASLQDYCAVDKFDFTAEAGNKGGQS